MCLRFLARFAVFSLVFARLGALDDRRGAGPTGLRVNGSPSMTARAARDRGGDPGELQIKASGARATSSPQAARPRSTVFGCGSSDLVSAPLPPTPAPPQVVAVLVAAHATAASLSLQGRLPPLARSRAGTPAGLVRPGTALPQPAPGLRLRLRTSSRAPRFGLLGSGLASRSPLIKQVNRVWRGALKARDHHVEWLGHAPIDSPY
ncbi:hypothetical protein NDU88_000005 [Pleurodeles waltl]|uniref:Secreted protein n=1 Tax=Pleurodeles waltl TaxID=8319 RepID=A0AAV7TDQ3_PLEWA|nr:hypothetical protein NDU88_000005 [Pleurodeles waltl]